MVRFTPAYTTWICEHAMKTARVFGWPVLQSVGTESPSI